MLNKLIDMCDAEQKAALAIPANAGWRKLAERDKHIAKSEAFLEVIHLIEESQS